MRDGLVLELEAIDDIKPYAEELVVFFDEAFASDDADALYGGSKLSEIAIVGMMLMGWTE